MIDPRDGLSVRSVGEWSRTKHHFLERYVDIFTRGMAAKWAGRLAYLDLFSGPGRWASDEDGEVLDGSPLIAARHGFERMVFVDTNPVATRALETRLGALGAAPRSDILTGDCNELIDSVMERIPPNYLTLAFLDPTNWQFHFESMRRLVEARSVDVILTFHHNAMKRVAHLPTQPRVDRFFGTKAWRGDGARKPTTADLAACYRTQMVSLGYLDEVSPDPPIVNSKRGPLYRMVFFSRNSRGYDFWTKACEVDVTGQLKLRL